MMFYRVVLFCSLLLGWQGSFAKRVLTQNEFNRISCDSLVLEEECSLDNQRVVLPSGFKLIFQGGSIDDGELVGSHSKVFVKADNSVFGLNLKLRGTWSNEEVYDKWFDFDHSESFIANQVISNILAMSNDEEDCHIYFDENRTYYFELPYKGPTDLGERVSFEMIDGKKDRHWYELYEDIFSFLRIFTIPSNTHITLNNKLQMLPTNQGAYFVFWEYGKQNVVIDGHGVISGDVLTHRYETPFKGPKSTFFGEWGMLLHCTKCKNFTLKDVTFENAFGDAVTFHGSYSENETGDRFSDGFVMENVKIINARRNGLTLGGRNIIVKNCYFEGCGSEKIRGTAPRSAIDLEPDHIKRFNEIGNENVLIDNCTFNNNYRDIASYMNNLSAYGKTATTISNCRFFAPVLLQGTYWITFKDCYFSRLSNRYDELSRTSNCRHLEFRNCVFAQIDKSEIESLKKQRNKHVECRYKQIN